MDEFFRYAYSGYKPVRHAINPVRVLEAVLCIICLALAVYHSFTADYMATSYKVILALIAAAFVIITLTDITVNCLRNPIYWPTWIIFSLSGAFSFFGSAGVLLAQEFEVTVIMAIVFSGITGLVFLIDTLLIICAQNEFQDVYPDEPEPRYKTPPIIDDGRERLPPKKTKRSKRKAHSAPPKGNMRDSQATNRPAGRESRASPTGQTRESQANARRGSPAGNIKPRIVAAPGPPQRPNRRDSSPPRTSIKDGSPPRTSQVTLPPERGASQASLAYQRDSRGSLVRGSQVGPMPISAANPYICDPYVFRNPCAANLSQPSVAKCPSDEVVYTRCEKVSESRQTTHEGKQTLQGFEKEKILEHSQEVKPSRALALNCLPPRPCTSYGGTFAIAKDEAPLPSPDVSASPSPPARSPNHRRSSVAVRSYPSQTLTRPASNGIRTDESGNAVLSDGTTLTKVQLNNGDVAYTDSNSVLYNKDGIPIVPGKSEGKATMKETLKKCLISEALIKKDGEYYTPEGCLVPPIQKHPDGYWLDNNGMPLLKIPIGGGNVAFESADGFLYTSAGVPYGYNVVLKSELQQRYEESIGGFQIEAENVITHEEKPVPPQQTTTTKTVCCCKSQRSCCSDGNAISLRESIAMTEQRPSSEPARRQRCLPDGTPLTACRTCSGTLLYKTEAGQLYTEDLKPVCFAQKRSRSPELDYSDSSSTLADRGKCTPSRTVSISTRMVPKTSPRSASAPSTPDAPHRHHHRNSRSADSPKEFCSIFTQATAGIRPQWQCQLPKAGQPGGCCCDQPKPAQPSCCCDLPESSHCDSGRQCPVFQDGHQADRLEKYTLQTISEVDTEGESFSSSSRRSPRKASLSRRSPKVSLKQNCKKCDPGTRTDEVCGKHRREESGFQTNETRMIKAADLQQYPVNLPGSTESSLC